LDAMNPTQNALGASLGLRPILPAAPSRQVESTADSQASREDSADLARDRAKSSSRGADQAERSHDNLEHTMRYLRRVLDPDVPDGLSEAERRARDNARLRQEGPPPVSAAGPVEGAAAAKASPVASREGKPKTGTLVNVVG
jgi:hypothetical protein